MEQIIQIEYDREIYRLTIDRSKTMNLIQIFALSDPSHLQFAALDTQNCHSTPLVISLIMGRCMKMQHRSDHVFARKSAILEFYYDLI